MRTLAIRGAWFLSAGLVIVGLASCGGGGGSGGGDTAGITSSTPDLAISITASTTSITAGDTFTLTATISNSGTEAAPSASWRFYQSGSPITARTGNPVAAARTSGIIAAGGSTTSSPVTVTAPPTAGLYWYGACIDIVSGETSTNNNCSRARLLTVAGGSGTGGPDLIISASSSASSVTVGQTFNLTATFRNIGTTTAPTSPWRYYRSSDSIITTSDTPISGAGTSSAIVSGGSATSPAFSATAPSTAGTYYYGACIDSVSGETNTNNNCSDGVRVIVSLPSGPDLRATLTVSDNTLTPGQSVTLRSTVSNPSSTATGRSSSTILRYYRSSDANITSSDTLVGTDAVSSIAVGGSGNESVSITAPTSAGTYYYGACVVAVAGELDTTNNCSSGVRVTVSAAVGRPDLRVTLTLSDNTLIPGQSVTVRSTVSNPSSTATGPSAATTLRYYVSTDSTISRSDDEVGTDAVSSIVVGGSRNLSTSFTIPIAVGTYYAGACVDAVPGELNTSNNCSSGVRVVVSNPIPITPGSWTANIADGCSDGLGIEWRVFGFRGSTLAGFWPPNSNNVYIVNGFGLSSAASGLCAVNDGSVVDKVCYGARPRSSFSTSDWGVGITGTGSCSTCCSSCPSGGTARLDYTLTCN